MTKAGVPAAAGVVLLLGVASLSAEPMFLSRQYNRCTSCHYSQTGGGLLTPYGQMLSRQELSTTGRSSPGAQPSAPGKGEESFLWGALGDSLGPLNLAFDTRPSHLSIDAGGLTNTQNFYMNADLEAAWRSHGWTVYGEIGRQPRFVTAASGGITTDYKIDSYEYWVSYQSEKGLGIRAGRFLPAYGINFADHTALTRLPMGFDVFDQVYGLELSLATSRHLLQVSVAPGRADSLIHDDGLQAFTATARFQTDLSPRSVLVLSGIYRGDSSGHNTDGSPLVPQNGAGGLAFGISPLSRLSIWTEGDVQFQHGQPGAPLYSILNETSVEVYRGVWLKVSPQLRTAYGDTSGGLWRLAFEADFFPRTHFHLSASYYRDETRSTSFVTKTFLAQLHLYL